MMSDKVYYYGDGAGNPVGPLRFDEIQNFVKAGVIPSDVMICEAGGENWQCLQELGEGSLVSAPTAAELTSIPLQNSASEAPVVTAGRLKILYIVALSLSLAAFALDSFSSRAAFENSGFDPNRVREIAAFLVWLTALAAKLALIFHIVGALPQHLRFTGPAAAAGFYLVPVFSLYWLFHIFHGLVTSVRKWGNETAPTLAVRISWLHAFAFIAAGLIALGNVLFYSDLFDAFEHPVAGIAKKNYTAAYFAYAAADAAFFYFTLCIVQLMGGLIDPEDHESEGLADKLSSFLTFGPIRLVQSYGYIAFFFIARSAWR